MKMEPPLVECDNNFDPPMVRITPPQPLPPFMVSWGVYQYLHDTFGLPPLICGAYSTEA